MSLTATSEKSANALAPGVVLAEGQFKVPQVGCGRRDRQPLMRPQCPETSTPWAAEAAEAAEAAAAR